jgi:hypothetical protein
MGNPTSTDVLCSALGIDKILETLADISSRLEEQREGPAWYNLRAACELKGATYNTVKSHPELQPKKGRADGTIGGRRVWSRATVEKWVKQLDGVKS